MLDQEARHRTTIAAAEVVKDVDSARHALEVCFANEVGALAHAMAVEGHEVMAIFCRDTKLNISPKYLLIIMSEGSAAPMPRPIRNETWSKGSSVRTAGGGGSGRPIIDLVEHEGVKIAYVCRLLPLTCLASDIVEAIMDGRQRRD